MIKIVQLAGTICRLVHPTVLREVYVFSIGRDDVAQISNLLYRRASSLRGLDSLAACKMSWPCRLEIGDTADWKSALR